MASNDMTCNYTTSIACISTPWASSTTMIQFILPTALARPRRHAVFTCGAIFIDLPVVHRVHAVPCAMTTGEAARKRRGSALFFLTVLSKLLSAARRRLITLVFCG
mmetsp:Transcript_27424/g.73790  ORF Transcript_27424/g.73790 Transcript_27424/m.73790 type:complete len:106 (+) Transcript_27424:1291-1608(+)